MPLYETPPICLLLGMDITRKVVTAPFCTTATPHFVRCRALPVTTSFCEGTSNAWHLQTLDVQTCPGLHAQGLHGALFFGHPCTG